MHTVPAQRQAFSEHLQELRSRLLSIGIALLMGTVIGYLLHSILLEFLLQPLNQPVFYSAPAGGLDFILKISLFFGFVVALPVVVYNLLRFIAPVLPQQSPRLLTLLFLASCILLIIGMSFAYWVTLPAALHFLSAFTSAHVQALITTDAYLSFAIRYLFGFGLLFQLPLIMLTINAVHPISVRTLMKFQRWVIVASFVLAAFITPTPDVFNQLLMALPIILLYQLTIILIALINRNRTTITH